MIIALSMHLVSLALNLISCSTEVSVGSHLTPMWRPNIIRFPLNGSPHGMAAILCHLSMCRDKQVSTYRGFTLWKHAWSFVALPLDSIHLMIFTHLRREYLTGARRSHFFNVHDDVIKWKHFPRYWPFVRRIHRSPVNSPHKGQWRGALMFSLIYARINGWVNNCQAGDLRRHNAHYDVIVMQQNYLCGHDLKCYLSKLRHFQTFLWWVLYLPRLIYQLH